MAIPRLCIGSLESYSGKSAVGLGLAQHYIDQKVKVAYMKPVGNVPITVDGVTTDEDAYLVNEAIGSPAPLESVAPLIMTTKVTEDALQGRAVDHSGVIKSAFDRVADENELVLIEGPSDLFVGRMLGASLPDISARLEAPVMLVIRSTNPAVVDSILAAKSLLGDRLIGTLFLSLPRDVQDRFNELVRPYLEDKGISIFGMFPEEKSLTSVTVGELAEVLGGEIICLPEKSEELVESYLVGAMGQERALRLFRRKTAKAVITGGDRPDIQLAALETPTKCLILTGNLYPSQSVVARAEEKEVPLILAPQDTFATVQIVESITGRIGFHQPRKVHRMRLLLEDHFDFDTLNKTLGI